MRQAASQSFLLGEVLRRVSRSTAAIIRPAPMRPIADKVSLSRMKDAAAVSMGWVH